METAKLLIADGNEDFALALRDVLQDVYHVRVTHDGKEALDILQSFRPEILVLDLMLPNLDGITLLQAAVSAGICPMVLAMSPFISEYVAETLTGLGVGYIMRKPCDIQAAAARVRDLSRHIHTALPPVQDPKIQSANLLISLNFRTKWDGYKYLKEAIVLLACQPHLSITKELYPAVAAICGSEGGRVERSIRTAVTSAWKLRDDRVWRLYFSADADGRISRPSNADFISRLAETLQL